MSVPIQVQLFDAFLGAQEGIHSIILPDIFSSGGARNLYIDKYGRAKKIRGYTALNTPITTDTGGSAVLGRGLFHYRKTSGGSTTRVEFVIVDDGVDEWEIWRSTDGGVTWSVVVDLGASSVGAIPDFAQFGDSLYITNGVIAPRVTADGVTITTAGSTQSPTPTASASASVGILNGVYQWKLVAVKSDKTRKYGSVTSNSLNVASKQATLGWSADSDVTVIGYEVYRTTGNGSVFYYVDYVDGRTTVAYTDNISDLTILSNRVLQEHGDPPPSGATFCEPHKQRIWWLRTSTYPTRGWFSDPALPDSVLTSSNYIEFSDSETVGDVITGAIGNYEGQLVVGTERAIWKVSGTGQVIGNIVDWTRIRTNAQIGWVSHRTVARIPAASKYVDQKGKEQITTVVTLAYLTPFGDIRLFDGDNDLIISLPMKIKLANFNYAQRQKSFCLHDTTRSEVTWVYPSSASGSEPAEAVTWNYRWGVWYSRDWAFGHAIEAEDSTHAQVLLAVSPSTTTGGYVYQLWSGNSFAGTAIPAQWMTKTLYAVNDQGQPALSNQKRFRWADLLFETEQTVTLTVEWLPGNTPDNSAAYGSTTVIPAAVGLLTSTGDRIMSGSGDHLVLSQASTLARAILQNSRGRYLHDTGIRLRVGDNASLGSWSLEAMNLAYQILPGLERRMQG